LKNDIFIYKINKKHFAKKMSELKSNSVVEEALLSMKNLEELISENAKGILASTMKEEISELVKESLSGSKKRNLHEQGDAPDEEGDQMPDEEGDQMPDEEDVEDEVEVDTEATPIGEPTVSTMDTNKPELPPLDMTKSPMSDVFKVFKAMGDEDGIYVKKDESGDIHIKDQENEYIIVMDDLNTQGNMNESEDMGFDSVLSGIESGEFEPVPMKEPKEMYKKGYEETEGEYYENEEIEEEDEAVFEIDQEALESVLESFKYSKNPNMSGGFDKLPKVGPKRHGKGGNAKSATKYPSKMKHGVTETSDEEKESQWTEEEGAEDLVYGEKDYKETETKEAARTLGNGKYWGRKGLPKVRTAPRHIRVESLESEVNLLREKNEEYKKALDFFRNKLNEVAVFNSNLAYSTRLFTEHSTTKQEKINILRRFDDVESLKESKNLYKSIKNELDGKGSTNVVKESIKESVQRNVSRSPQTGSATNLIETKTYENPQFLRMKDLMAKIQ